MLCSSNYDNDRDEMSPCLVDSVNRSKCLDRPPVRMWVSWTMTDLVRDFIKMSSHDYSKNLGRPKKNNKKSL